MELRRCWLRAGFILGGVGGVAGAVLFCRWPSAEAVLGWGQEDPTGCEHVCGVRCVCWQSVSPCAPYLQDDHVGPVLLAQPHVKHEKLEHVEGVLLPHV